MRSKLLYSFLFLQIFFVACKDAGQNSTTTSENDIDAARNFIQAALDGNYRKARQYILADSVNDQFISSIERVRLNEDERRGLKESSINIHNIKRPNDSTTVVIFSNSFKNNHDTLKVVKLNNQWLVDVKYIEFHKQDTLFYKPVIKDSINK